MARITDDDITKKGLVAKFNLEMDEKENEIKELKIKLDEKEKECKSLKRGISIYSTDDSTKKKILELRSKYYSPIRIVETFSHFGEDIELDSVKDIVNNIDELDIEYSEYYRECVEKYENNIKINPNIQKQSSLNEVVFLMDETMEMIRECSDNAEKDKYMRSYNDYIKTKTSLLKDVVFGEEEKDRSIEILDSTMEEYRENSCRIVKLSINPSEIKTLKNIN